MPLSPRLCPGAGGGGGGGCSNGALRNPGRVWLKNVPMAESASHSLNFRKVSSMFRPRVSQPSACRCSAPVASSVLPATLPNSLAAEGRSRFLIASPTSSHLVLNRSSPMRSCSIGSLTDARASSTAPNAARAVGPPSANFRPSSSASKPNAVRAVLVVSELSTTVMANSFSASAATSTLRAPPSQSWLIRPSASWPLMPRSRNLVPYSSNVSSRSFEMLRPFCVDATIRSNACS